MSDDQLNHPDDRLGPSTEESVDVGGHAPPSEESADIGGHPKGTLAIVGIYGLLFVIGWLIMYFGVFVPRGPLTE